MSLPTWRSHTRFITLHDKSIALGGGKVLFPISEANVEEIHTLIVELVRAAESSAYDRGFEAAQYDMRHALGLAND